MNDTILTVFSSPAAPVVQQWLQRFHNPPRVVDVPGGNSNQFSAQGRIAAQDFPAYVHARNPQHNGRIAVVTFSAGWAFAHALSQSPAAMGLVDTIVLLDGLHSTLALEGLAAYAERCSYGTPADPLLLMIHSQIVPPFVSAKHTNCKLMEAAKEGPNCHTPPLELQALPRYFTHPGECDLPAPGPDNVLHLGNQFGRAMYAADPLADYDNAGNVWRIEYRGTNAAIHIYIANYVQPRAWAMLAERWNGEVA